MTSRPRTSLVRRKEDGSFKSEAPRSRSCKYVSKFAEVRYISGPFVGRVLQHGAKHLPFLLVQDGSVSASRQPGAQTESASPQPAIGLGWSCVPRKTYRLVRDMPYRGRAGAEFVGSGLDKAV